MLGVTFLMFTNIATVIIVILRACNLLLPEPKTSNPFKIIIVLFAALIFAINYFFLLGGKKHYEIVVSFQNETQKQKKVGTIKLGLYVFLTFAVPFIAAVLYHKFHPKIPL